MKNLLKGSLGGSKIQLNLLPQWQRQRGRRDNVRMNPSALAINLLKSDMSSRCPADIFSNGGSQATQPCSNNSIIIFFIVGIIASGQGGIAATPRGDQTAHL